MKNFTLFIVMIAGLYSFGQNLKAITLIPQRTYHLNCGARATYVGGLSRETIKIDLPPNTKSWYYSFTTAPNGDGTELLNLGIQVTAALYGGMNGSTLAQSFKVPKGSGSADVFVLTPTSRDAFLRKEETNWFMYKDISVQNTLQAVQYVDAKHGSSFYLGLKNPSSTTGIDIAIEVVAIVDETKIDTEKGILYGNLGWKAYEKGEYEKCIELSNKALTFDPNLVYVKFNIALVYLAQQKDSCIDFYIDAISSCKNDKDPKTSLAGALQDIRNLKTQNFNLKNISEMEDIVNTELNRY